MAIRFDKSVLKSIKIAVRPEIMRAYESDKDIRNEMKRVFQQANRRIQNIRRKKLISPAITALGDIPEGYTVFGMKGSFNELKIQYAKAIAFLQQPTSTARGARTYGEYIKSTYKLSDTEYKAAGGALTKAVQSLSDSKLGQALLQYKDFSGYFENSATDVAALIEEESITSLNKINAAISNMVDTSTDNVSNEIMSRLEDLFNDFDI